MAGRVQMLWKGTEALGAGLNSSVLQADADGEYLKFMPNSGSEYASYFVDVTGLTGGGAMRVVVEFHQEQMVFPVIILADNVASPITTIGLFNIPIHGNYDGAAGSGKNAMPPVTRIAFEETTGTSPVTLTGTIYAVYA